MFTPPLLKPKDIEQQGERECVGQIIIESVDNTPRFCCFKPEDVKFKLVDSKLIRLSRSSYM